MFPRAIASLIPRLSDSAIRWLDESFLIAYLSDLKIINEIMKSAKSPKVYFKYLEIFKEYKIFQILLVLFKISLNVPKPRKSVKKYLKYFKSFTPFWNLSESSKIA